MTEYRRRTPLPDEAVVRPGGALPTVQPNEVWVGDHLHEALVTQCYLGGSPRAAKRSAIAFMPQLERRRDASAHMGD